MKKSVKLLLFLLVVVVLSGILVVLKLLPQTLAPEASRVTMLFSSERFTLESDRYDFVHEQADQECVSSGISDLLYLLDKQTKRRTLIKDDLCLAGDIGSNISIVEGASTTYVFFPYGGGDALVWDVIRYQNDTGEFTSNTTYALERALAEKWDEKFKDNTWLYLESPTIVSTSGIDEIYFELKGYVDGEMILIATVKYDISNNSLIISKILSAKYSNFAGTIVE